MSQGSSGGPLLKKKTDGWSPLPTYVDFEDVFAALELIRRKNIHGYGYNEPLKKKKKQAAGAGAGSGGAGSGGAGSGGAGSGGAGGGSGAPGAGGDPDDEIKYPWLNTPFVDARHQPLGTGNGTLLPYVLEWDRTTKRLAPSDHGPQRTNCVTATFNALCVALARGVKDSTGTYQPVIHGGRFKKRAYQVWYSIGIPKATWTGTKKEQPDEGGVNVVVNDNLGVQLSPRWIRRGDVVQINWQEGGSHAVFCWDARFDGDDIWLQVISSQASTAGVGVIVSHETLSRDGTLEPVRRKNATLQHPVLKIDRSKPWLETAEARAYYRRHGHWFRLKGKPEDSGTKIGSLYVGRFHRLFPRFPLEIHGSTHVSDLETPLPGAANVPAGHEPGTPARTRESSSELYFANNEGPGGAERRGGFFPLAASRTWHGGVHLYPEAKADEVYSPFDGQLLAARLSTPANASKFGDPGFVLIRTKLKLDGQETTFFTLLAHLAADPGSALVPWLDELMSTPPDSDPRWTKGLDKKKKYFEILVAPAASHRPRDGADAADGSLNVYDKRDRKKAPKGTLAVGEVVEATSSLDAHGWAKVKKLDGSLEGFVPGEGRLGPVDVHPLDPKIKAKRDALLRGEVADLSDLDRKIVVRAGEVVGRAGSVGGEKAIHFQVFSKDLVRMLGKTRADIEDTSDELFWDRAKFEQKFFQALDQSHEGGGGQGPSLQHFMINGPTRREDDALQAAEVRAFFAKSPLRKRLRTLITRHHSEWGDKIDWKKLDTAPQWKHASAADKQAFRDAVEKLQWWKGSFLESAGLPPDHVCYHYHPITFLTWIDSKREADASGELHASVFELNHDDLPQGAS